MARTLDAVCTQFLSSIAKPLQLPVAAELVRISAPIGSAGRRAFNATKIESIYELAYLRMFGLWERFLEDAFYRLLCGYTAGGNVIPFTPSACRSKTLADAETQVLGGRPYKLWHNPQHVVGRSKQFFVSGPHEIVLSSALTRISQLADIRHHIAHATADTQRKYHLATMSIAGARFGIRAGRFLRSRTVAPATGIQVRWLDLLADDLSSFARQFN